MIQNRIQLAEHFALLGFTRGAEIGVADGRYSEILYEKIPGLELTCVDPFYRVGHYDRAKERLTKYNANIIKKTSMEAVLDFSDGFFDFVFIDGNHSFDYVMEDIIGWGRKVRKGGIISLHDYYDFHNSGVKQAVNIYTEIHKLDLNIIPRYSGGHKDDQAPCAWWIKK